MWTVTFFSDSCYFSFVPCIFHLYDWHLKQIKVYSHDLCIFSKQGKFIDSGIKFYNWLGCTVNGHKNKLNQISITARSYLQGAQRGAVIQDIGETHENLPTLRATRADNKGVVTKLIGQAGTILDGTHPLEEKARNRLARNEKKIRRKLSWCARLRISKRKLKTLKI